MRFIGNLVLLLNSCFSVVFSSRFPVRNLIDSVKTVAEKDSVHLSLRLSISMQRTEDLVFNVNTALEI